MKPEYFFAQADAYIDQILSEKEQVAFEQKLETDPVFSEDFQLYLIEQYLSGALADQAKERVEVRMQEDEAFAGELRWHQQVQAELKKQGHAETRKELTAIFPRLTAENLQVVELDQKPPTRWRSLFVIAAIAASILAIIIAGFYYYPSSTDSNRLFAAYFEPYPMQISVRGSQDQQTLLHQAIEAYQDKQFEAAVTYFSQLNTLEPTDPQIQLYLGIALLSSGKEATALPIFRGLENHFLFDEQARWYLALSHLKMNHIRESEESLRNIAGDTKNRYQKQAAILLTEMGPLSRDE